SCKKGASMTLELAQKLSESDEAQVYDIWNSGYPMQVLYKTRADFNTALKKKDPIHLICRTPELKVAGWLSTFTRDNERFFVLLVANAWQGQGVGRKLVDEMKIHEAAVAGWAVASDKYAKADGTPYPSPLGF